MPVNSGTVTANSDSITAAQYNALLSDISSEHNHSGSADYGKQLTNDSLEDHSIGARLRKPITDYIYVPATLGYNHVTGANINVDTSTNWAPGIPLPNSGTCSAYGMFTIPKDGDETGSGIYTLASSSLYVLVFGNAWSDGNAYIEPCLYLNILSYSSASIGTCGGTSTIAMGSTPADYKNLQYPDVSRFDEDTYDYPTVCRLTAKRHAGDGNDTYAGTCFVCGWYLSYERL